MRKIIYSLLAILVLIPSTSFAQQQENYDYWQHQREIVARGQQAVFMCNGLFTSNRTLEQVFNQELAFLSKPIGTAAGGDYKVNWDLRAVEIGLAGEVPIMRAAFREGLGCVSMPPDQTLDDINELPELTMPALAGDADNVLWPNGDLLANSNMPPNINTAALIRASDWAFDRETPEQDTLSLLVIYNGQIIHERYALGVDVNTRTRTWSTVKSITSTLVGMLVDQGKMSLDMPLGIEWLPAIGSPELDPRNNITLRHALNMSSGLISPDNNGMEYATGSGLSYWAGASSINGVLSRALIREPGTHWDYENYDNLLAVYAMKQALGDEKTYAEYPRKALFDKIGMRNTVVSSDRFGDYILSSQAYINARDLGRFGLLYLNNGMWNGERLISEDWINFVRTPAPATVGRGGQYGGQFWLVPEGRADVPADAYTTNGNRGQYTVIVPSHNLVIVRRGLDYGGQGFNPWDLTREVLQAIE